MPEYAGIRRAISTLRAQAAHREVWPQCACPWPRTQAVRSRTHDAGCREMQTAALLRQAADLAAADLAAIEHGRPAA